MKLSLPLFFTLAVMSAGSVFAQVNYNDVKQDESTRPNIFQRMNESGVLNHLDLSLNAGTTGLGLEVSSPITEWARVRVGVDWMPRFDVPLYFDIQSYTDDGKINSSNFSKAQELMESLTGFEVDETVVMNGTPTMTQFKFLIDVYPFRSNRHWHFTAGFYAGSRQIAKACNTIEEMPSLLAIGIYNRAYEFIKKTDFVDTPLDIPGYGDLYLDPDLADVLKEKFESFGRLGVHMGDYKNGAPYIMEPDKDGTLRARALVNAVRPYLGFGYGGALSSDKRWTGSFDVGAMIWGGSPDVITHDGVNMTTELDNVRGKVGTYLGLIKTMKVFPVVSLRIAYTLF